MKFNQHQKYDHIKQRQRVYKVEQFKKGHLQHNVAEWGTICILVWYENLILGLRKVFARLKPGDDSSLLNR